MTDRPSSSRRGFLGGAGGVLAAVGACPFAHAASSAPNGVAQAGRTVGRAETIAFRGQHQAGIVTELQNHTYFAAFDILDTHEANSGYGGKTGPVRAVTRTDIARLMQAWTEAADLMTAGKPSQADSGEALGLAPSRLTITIGFGSSLFMRCGQDRFGLAAHRPLALVDMPHFQGDQLQPARTGGDISVQACADDPQTAFHAVRQLARLGDGMLRMRWVQPGFSSNAAATDTPRNLMGFKDGTQNPRAEPAHETTAATRDRVPAGTDSRDLDQIVWVRDEGPAWMRGGSYLVARRIRMSLEHWDRSEVAFQEQVIGRRKQNGAPLTGKSEFDPIDLAAADANGNPVIAENAHVRLASVSVSGTQVLRRGYSYNDGVSFIAERWPPWHQGMEYDAGLLFIAYQKDPREGFIKMFRGMATIDALNQYTTHTGGGLFACPKGVEKGSYIGRDLLA